ncbi:MAG: hypothetical protein EOO11_20950, partial [Chitinophagaceae bacterium]
MNASRTLVLFAALSMLTACNSGPADSSPGTPNDSSAPSATATKKDDRSAPGHFVVKSQPFSDPLRNDEFRLALTDGPLLNSRVRFTIKNADGQLIHDETFS